MLVGELFVAGYQRRWFVKRIEDWNESGYQVRKELYVRRLARRFLDHGRSLQVACNLTWIMALAGMVGNALSTIADECHEGASSMVVCIALHASINAADSECKNPPQQYEYCRGAILADLREGEHDVSTGFP